MTTTAAEAEGPALTMRVAEEVRALMGRRNLSRVKLAEQLGQSRTYVGRRLSGETAFDLDDLEAISKVFNVPVASLMGIVSMPRPPEPPVPFPASPETPGAESVTPRYVGGELGGVVIPAQFGAARPAPSFVPAAAVVAS